MMTSTPVAVSKARMFRPSRPMIRPFISSLGSATAATVLSAVCSAASRWIAIEMIRRASRSAVRRGLLLDVAHQRRGLAPRLVLDPLEDLAPGILRGEAGDALELDALLLRQPVGLALAGCGAPAPAGVSASSRCAAAPLAGLDLLELPLLRPGPLVGPALQPLPLLPPPLDLAVELLPQLERLHLGREQQIRLGRFRLALRASARSRSASARAAREHAGGARDADFGCRGG